jgi:hypothetical protein
VQPIQTYQDDGIEPVPILKKKGKKKKKTGAGLVETEEFFGSEGN